MIKHIDTIDIPELNIFHELKEGQLLHINEPDLGLFIAESPNVIARALNAGYEPVCLLCDEQELKGDTLALVEGCGNVPTYVATTQVLKEISGFNLTRGLLCAMKRKELPKATDLCKGMKRIAVLEDVVNPTNVGAIFRSAAALNMDCVLLTKPCADPLYRRAARVSMGTVFQIPWTYIDSYREIREMGFKLAAMALEEKSVNVDDEALNAEEKLAIILGSEGPGLKPETVASCDYTVCIPMGHGVDSLNVAAASAVAFYELAKKH